MKPHSYKLLLLAVLLALPFALQAAPPKTAASKTTNSLAQAQNTKSTFVMPRMPKEGRDPFFPNATAIYGTAATTTNTQANVGASLLKLRGFLGTSYAQINNVTLQVGETQEIKTAGGPVSVRLVEIKLQDELVVIEVNGQRQELGLGRAGRSLTPK